MAWSMEKYSWQLAGGSGQQEERGQKQFTSHLPSASLGHYASLSFVVRDVGMKH
jgi:hypothetical protein